MFLKGILQSTLRPVLKANFMTGRSCNAYSLKIIILDVIILGHTNLGRYSWAIAGTEYYPDILSFSKPWVWIMTEALKNPNYLTLGTLTIIYYLYLQCNFKRDILFSLYGKDEFFIIIIPIRFSYWKNIFI